MAPWLVALFLAVLVVFVVLVHSIDFRIDAEELEAIFADSPYPLRTRTIAWAGGEVFYAAVGDPERPLVLFIHGTPGSWDNFAAIMGDRELLDRAYLASLDRPGFGGSNRGRAEPSLAAQAAAVEAVIADAGGGKPALLVGHSLGGPIAVRAAVDFPAEVSGLVLVAPSVDPALEKLWWIQRPADHPLLAWAVPTDLRTCNREVLQLADELTRLLPHWHEIAVPITVIQGEKDSLVPAANVDFVVRELDSAPLVIERFPDLNHFIPWSHPKIIVDAIRRHLDALE